MTARILVVDDIEANVRLLEAKLSAEYYEVLSATDGPTAMAMAASQKPDIILLDVMMPGMDGFQVCRRLKEDAATRHIPVVLITALDGRADTRKTGRITITMLNAYITERVKELTSGFQTPIFKSQDDLGDFPLTLLGTPE